MKPLVIPLKLKGRVNLWDLTREAIARAIDEAAKRITRELPYLTPKGATGHLQGSFFARGKSGGIDLIWPEDYAEAVDKGARRHMIVPKSGKILSF